MKMERRIEVKIKAQPNFYQIFVYCNVHMYCITPEIQGVYSIAEIIHSAHLANTYGTSVDKVVFVVLKDERWSKSQIKSLNATMTLVKNIARENALVGYVSNMRKLIELI